MELKLLHEYYCATRENGKGYNIPVRACTCNAEAQARLTCKQIVDMFDEQVKGDTYVLDVENIIEQLRAEAGK